MVCKYCSGHCVKAGIRNGIQKLRCRSCRKHQQEHYKYIACTRNVDHQIVTLLKESSGIRSISRILTISISTVVRRIKKIARHIEGRHTGAESHVYEIDEIWTYIGTKANEVWITYAIERKTKNVAAFRVGARTKDNLQHVVSSALALSPSRVCTDGLVTYKGLVPSHLHRIGLPHTRRIERFNLNLRTHLKRLSRKTICFSKSIVMLEACLKIYFWS